LDSLIIITSTAASVTESLSSQHKKSLVESKCLEKIIPEINMRYSPRIQGKDTEDFFAGERTRVREVTAMREDERTGQRAISGAASRSFRSSVM